jgi:hypothetical protein
VVGAGAVVAAGAEGLAVHADASMAHANRPYVNLLRMPVAARRMCSSNVG